MSLAAHTHQTLDDVFLPHAATTSIQIYQGSYRQVSVKFKDFSMTSKSISNSFQDLHIMKNNDLSVKILIPEMLD